MKCLTLRPAWAGLVASGDKSIENRTWKTQYRGEIGIHSGSPIGAIIAITELVEIISPEEAMERFPEQADYIHGPFCWVLENTQRIDPIHVRGKLRLWNY